MNRIAAYCRYLGWYVRGKPVPSPHLAKQALISHYAMRNRLRIFLETGTFRGDMVYAMRSRFDQIISIELDRELYERARTRFAGYRHIQIVYGDSSKVLTTIIASINRPCLFWLDGHYSGAGTAMGDIVSPILDELTAILRHPICGHVILIDDARLFTGEGGYPTLNHLFAITHAYHPTLTIEVRDDIVRIVPAVGTT